MSEKTKVKAKEDELDIHLSNFLDPTNDYEACVKEIEENIPKVVEANPGITTYEVYQREKARMIKYSGMATDAIRKAFTEALANNLGEEIKCLGKAKKIDGRFYEQLTLNF